MQRSHWQREQEDFNARISHTAAVPASALADPNGLCLLAHADFEAQESVYEPAPYIMINLCTAHLGKMKREGDGPTLEGVIRPGTVAMSLPHTSASGYWSKTQQLGIAINPNALSEQHQQDFNSENLLAAASELHQDSLISSVMIAMWRDAEVNGLSSAFFEQGIFLLLNHLAKHTSKVKQPDYIYPLRGPKLKLILELLESRVTEDISVSELANVAQQDIRSFSRSFSAATGFSPYAYFTYRRMEFAKNLLKTTALTVTQIAQTVGYANPSKFSAAFKRTYSITPSQWRALVK